MTFSLSPLLRFALRLDAAASAMTALVCLTGPGVLANVLGLPAQFLVMVGLTCLAWAVVTGFTSTRRQVAAWAIWAIIAFNAVWVLESVMLLVLGWVQPTALGVAFVLVQALAVAMFAELQFIGLRRSRSALAI